jgi:hypothetical protein
VRFAATVVLWLATTVVLAVAIPTAWAQKNVVDIDGYAAMAQKAAADPALQSAMAAELTTRVMVLITQAPRHHDPVDSSWVHGVAAAYTASPSFPPQFAQANRAVHAWLFTDSDNQPWVIDLAPMLKDSRFEQVLNRFKVQVPATVTVPLTVATPKSLQPGQLRPLTSVGPWVSVGAAVLAGVGVLLTVAAARSRGKALTSLGVSALLVGAGGWAAIEVGRRYIDDALNRTTGDIRPIADVMIGHAKGSLHQWLNLTLAAGGVLVVLGVFVALLGGLRKRSRAAGQLSGNLANIGLVG